MDAYGPYAASAVSFFTLFPSTPTSFLFLTPLISSHRRFRMTTGKRKRGIDDSSQVLLSLDMGFRGLWLWLIRPCIRT